MEKTINLNASIDYLELYFRASNFLKRNNINTIWQLVSLTEEELEKMPGSEWMIITDIKQKLIKLNLYLGMTLDDLEQTPNDDKMFDDSIIKHQSYNERLKELNDNKKRKIIILNSILEERIKLEEESNRLDDEIKKLDTILNEKTLKF